MAIVTLFVGIAIGFGICFSSLVLWMIVEEENRRDD